MSQSLLSWGRHPARPQSSRRPHWIADIPSALNAATYELGTALPYGNGRSYGDSCLAASDTVIDMRGLDRLIHADWKHGRIEVEAGITLAAVLEIIMPRGWFLPVVPGTKHITVGGAIANDVHGKNHARQGTFGRHVNALGLYRSDRGLLPCSTRDNSDLFRATLGGLGLTGIIVTAQLQLTKIASSQMTVTKERFDNVSDYFSLASAYGSTHEHSVAWVDCLARGPALGRGIFMAGNVCDAGPLTAPSNTQINVPMTPPFSIVNPFLMKAFNAHRWHRQLASQTFTEQGVNAFFFPLDGIGHWNRLYGRRGLQQYQVVIGRAVAQDAIAEMLAAIAASGTGSCLAVIKQFGDIDAPGLISFPHEGTTLALDFPHDDAALAPLFDRLDAITREVGGRLYPAKDAHMSAEDFQQSYPEWESLEALRDPRLMSQLWKRVTQ